MVKNNWLIGIDEAGRGPLAGPVAVGLVAIKGELPKDLLLTRDSKKLSPKKRAEWFEIILRNKKDKSFKMACELVSNNFIDKNGISEAINLAIINGLKKLDCDQKNSLVFLDGGLKAPIGYKNQRTIIKGDETEPLISLASVVAKVTRDNYMLKIAKQYKVYNFDKHKGYGTKDHYQAIRKHGLTKIHRQSFISIDKIS